MFIIISITILYSFLIIGFIIGFYKIKAVKLNHKLPKTKFSIVIPFRNEAKNLPNLLKSISLLKYSEDLFEVILVNDESEDESIKIIKEQLHHLQLTTFNIRVINNERVTKSPKKDAITTAIKQSSFDWIITTDADCTLPEFWLNSFDELIQTKDTKCIVAPVKYKFKKGFLNQFQILSILSLQGTTIGSFGLKKPFMCNGANFAYTKAIFQELNGFKGNDFIASGDDVFFLEKAIKHCPKQVKYLKNKQAIVETNPAKSWSSLISQNLRWAAKSSSYKSFYSKFIGIIVFLMNLFLICCLFLFFFKTIHLKVIITIIFLKFTLDFILISISSHFFNQKRVLKSFLPNAILYPFFTAYIALLSTLKTYDWKGRTHNK